VRVALLHLIQDPRDFVHAGNHTPRQNG
jgi:hypothetical protein